MCWKVTGAEEKKEVGKSREYWGCMCAMSDGEALTGQETRPRGGTERTHWNLGESFPGRVITKNKGPEAGVCLEYLKSSSETR